MFAPDGVQPGKNFTIVPTLYLLFDMTVNDKDHGLIKVWIKLGVEEFLFRGADLFWPGVWKISSDEFKANQVVVIYA
jgi:predicted ribosome-associated RNA-binding protein Tma20